MATELQIALINQLIAMADDELILGHRNSEWCGHAPILEEDIAFTNLALDEIGHASGWYELIAELTGDDSQALPDQLVYFRPAVDFRCIQMVELPRGDWAFSILRQYLFDAAEAVRLEALEASTFVPLSERAAKVRREEIYHLRHSSAWARRLALGTDESQARMQAALDELWPYTAQLFAPLPHEDLLWQASFIPEASELRAAWQRLVLPFLAECGLKLPEEAQSVPADRSQHTPYFKPLVTEMQSVARQESEAEW
jgi:ring-1,2-phenylacetyl-CoA epoxidase subunit PaaC